MLAAISPFALAGCSSSSTTTSTTPTVTSLAPVSGPVGTSVLIVGTNFGSAQNGSTVTFNGATVTTVTAWSPTSITALVPAGATTGPVVATVGGMVSNPQIFTLVYSPGISSVVPIAGQIGASVTITGINFGTTQGSSTVTFNNVSAGTAASWGNTSIVVNVPAGATTGPLVVTVGGAISNSITFTVQPGSLSGAVRGAWVAGVTVSVAGGPTTTTDANGNYSFSNLPSGTYTVTPSLPGYSYTPAAPAVRISGDARQNFVAAPAAASLSISGTLTYAGTRTGEALIRVYDSACYPGCSPVAGTIVPSANGPYTVQGLQPLGAGSNGTYVVNAEIDTSGKELPNASNPSGTSSPVTVTTASLTGVDIAISDHAAPAPAAPTALRVAPGSNVAVIHYTPAVDAGGEEIATSYKVYVGTDSAASNLVPVAFASQGAGPHFFLLSGLASGATYFKVAAVNSAGESGASSVIGPVAIGSTAGATVSGSVTFSGDAATGPLYVGLRNENGAYDDGDGYFVSIPNPVSPQAFSISGVPNGSYRVLAAIDRNNDGEIDAGDIDNIRSYGGPSIAVNGDTTANVTLSSTPAILELISAPRSSASNGGQQAGAPAAGRNLRFIVAAGSKQPVAVTLVSAPGVAVPVDLPVAASGRFEVSLSPSNPPAPTGETYLFSIAFSDGTTELMPIPLPPAANPASAETSP